MGKVVDLRRQRTASAAEAKQGSKNASVFKFDGKKLFFEPKLIPPADRNRICIFCSERAARWYIVHQNNMRLFFEKDILFCLNSRCARLARREITQIAPPPSLPTLMQRVKNVPALIKDILFPKKNEPT